MKPKMDILNSVSLFAELKDTNISSKSFKNILSSYKNLEEIYSKTKEADLLKDLNKQKQVIFSYLPCCKTATIKKIASVYNSMNSEIGSFDEINTFDRPSKNIQFIDVAYDNGMWKIYAHNLDNLEFTKDETPEAINSLVKLANRLDEQEAAYALCHAKKAGLFTFATLPYVRTEDFTDTALETRFIKDPGTTLGPVEHSYNSTLDNANMPVSRQIAAISDEDGYSFDEGEEVITFDDIKEGYKIEDTVNEDVYFVTNKTSYGIITTYNDVIDKDEVEENISSGKWRVFRAAENSSDLEYLRNLSDDDKKKYKKKLEKRASKLLENYDKKLTLIEAANRLKAEFDRKIDLMIEPDIEKADQIISVVEPELKTIAEQLDALTVSDKKSAKKFQKLRYAIGGKQINYEKPIENYQVRAVSDVKKVDELLTAAEDYVSPRKLKDFEKNVVEKFFYMNSRAEKFSITLAEDDPEQSEKVQENYENLRKTIKPSLFNKFYKDSAYKKLDNLLENATIDFRTYNKYANLIHINAKQVLASLNKINLRKPVRKVVSFNLIDSLKSLFDKVVKWFSGMSSYLTLENKESLDINEKLDEVIEED